MSFDLTSTLPVYCRENLTFHSDHMATIQLADCGEAYVSYKNDHWITTVFLNSKGDTHSYDGFTAKHHYLWEAIDYIFDMLVNWLDLPKEKLCCV